MTVCAGVAPRSAVTAFTGVSIRITGMTSATDRYRDHDDDSSAEQAPRQQSSPFVPREGQGETSYEDEKRRKKLGGRPNDLATAHSRSISARVSMVQGGGCTGATRPWAPRTEVTVWAGSTRATRPRGTYELLGLAEVVDDHDGAQPLSGAHVDAGPASVVDPQPVWGGGQPGDEPVEQALVHTVVGSAGDRGDLMDRDGARVERRVHVQLGVGPSVSSRVILAPRLARRLPYEAASAPSSSRPGRAM